MIYYIILSVLVLFFLVLWILEKRKKGLTLDLYFKSSSKLKNASKIVENPIVKDILKHYNDLLVKTGSGIVQLMDRIVELESEKEELNTRLKKLDDDIEDLKKLFKELKEENLKLKKENHSLKLLS